MEPICAEVFPGNYIDSKTYTKFIQNNDIKKGIIVADKDFPPSKIKDELEMRPDLHFLTPIKRNDVRIVNNNMLDFEGVLDGVDSRVLYKKSRINGGRYLYAFEDTNKEKAEKDTFIDKSKKEELFKKDKYYKKKELFGVIVFESDLDMPAKVAYSCYEDRWLLELVFKRYKSDECLDKTRVQGDFSVIGAEFIHFISTLATCRIIRKAKLAGLLDHLTYGDLMEDLSSAWRTVNAPEYATSDDGYWINTCDMVFAELEALGLSIGSSKFIPKKRGRPQKNTVNTGIKRKRGRPKKQTQTP
jgi:hypothetical protein